LKCTLLSAWVEGHDTAWLVVTDLSPEQANVFWYSMRAWIEAGFKDLKRGGWQWQYTKITDSYRASRIMLVLSVATLWTVSVGGEIDAAIPSSSFTQLPETHVAHILRRFSKPKPRRIMSCLRKGYLVILGYAIKGIALPFGQFIPEPWLEL